MAVNLRRFAPLLALLSFACAPRFLLRPTGDNIVEREGTDFVFEDAPECRVEATYIDERLENSLLKFHLHNRGTKPLTIEHAQFRLEGTPFVEATLVAVSPAAHDQKLKKQIELIEKRLKSPQWDGVSDIHTYMGAEKSDGALEKSKKDYKKNEDERKLAEEKLQRLNREIEMLKADAFTKTEIPPGGNAEGTLIFEARFVREGDTRLILENSKCAVGLPFAARVTKDSIF